jgi:hypothetical protein
MAANLDPKTQALKLIVIVMSVLIVVCIVIVGVTIYRRATTMAERPVAFEPVSLGLGAHCEIAEVTAGDGRIYLRMAPADGCPLVLVLNGATGEPVGRIER